MNCIFCKLIAKQIPTNIIYEDNDVFVFEDISPKADIHYLLIPKIHISSMLELSSEHTNLMGKLLITANHLALQQNLTGYKININTGKNGGQEVFHLHIHLLANK